MLRKAAGSRGKVERNEELEVEYQAVMKIMITQIRLSQYDPTKKLQLVIDGAKTVGTGFLLIQYLNDKKPEKSIIIINSGLGLLGLMDIHLADVDNKKLQEILERAGNYNWVLNHIKGSDNKICDALSRLCTKGCLDYHKYVTRTPRLLQTSKRAAIRKKQLEMEDPLVMKIAEEGNLELEHLEMLNKIENEQKLKIYL